jgi:hypothetical protein
VAALDEPTADRYEAVAARVILLGGGKSQRLFTTTLFDQLSATIRCCTTEVIAGLDHLAPHEKAADLVADRVRHHLLQRAA